MKNLFKILAAILITASVFAQVPQKMSYQAVIRNNSGKLLINRTVGMQISILQGSATGSSVYTETQTPTTNANGLVTIEIGMGTTTYNFAAIDWATGIYFIKTETDTSGGTNYTITGTSQLLSVPYALYAGNIPNGINIGDIQYWNGTTWVIVPVGQPGQFLKLSATGIPAWSGATYPTVTTQPINILTTSATSGGNVTSDGGATVTARGVCWSTLHNPDTSNNHTIDGAGTGIFTSSITTGLIPYTTYYVRAYASSSIGTSYGNELSFTTLAGPFIGQLYQGGILAYILLSGDPGYDVNVLHGLIAAPSDQSTGIQWYNGSYISTGAWAGCSLIIIILGSGKANTDSIVIHQGIGNYAAYLCDTLNLGGYNDWYLPSSSELRKLYLNKIAIGGFTNNGYWTSCDETSSSAVRISFFDNYWDDPNKNCLNYVRAVRSF